MGPNIHLESRVETREESRVELLVILLVESRMELWVESLIEQKYQNMATTSILQDCKLQFVFSDLSGTCPKLVCHPP